mmetsp:Transcript_21181/g.35029  ORF Transcript_21181/g.35029 Transcript_21181/m.35029 type:complete len:82 (+) Transcript_21181:916-1161(+)
MNVRCAQRRKQRNGAQCSPVGPGEWRKIVELFEKRDKEKARKQSTEFVAFSSNFYDGEHVQKHGVIRVITSIRGSTGGPPP